MQGIGASPLQEEAPLHINVSLEMSSISKPRGKLSRINAKESRAPQHENILARCPREQGFKNVPAKLISHPLSKVLLLLKQHAFCSSKTLGRSYRLLEREHLGLCFQKSRSLGNNATCVCASLLRSSFKGD